LFRTVVQGIGRLGRGDEVRVIVEKPFGRDLASAEDLSRTIHAVLTKRASFASITTSAKKRCKSPAVSFRQHVF
jgi:hypothetical protein